MLPPHWLESLLTLETFLEQVTITKVLVIVVINVAGGYAFDDISDSVFTLTDKKMEMVGHETVAVERE